MLHGLNSDSGPGNAPRRVKMNTFMNRKSNWAEQGEGWSSVMNIGNAEAACISCFKGSGGLLDPMYCMTLAGFSGNSNSILLIGRCQPRWLPCAHARVNSLLDGVPFGSPEQCHMTDNADMSKVWEDGVTAQTNVARLLAESNIHQSEEFDEERRLWCEKFITDVHRGHFPTDLMLSGGGKGNGNIGGNGQIGNKGAKNQPPQWNKPMQQWVTQLCDGHETEVQPAAHEDGNERGEDIETGLGGHSQGHTGNGLVREVSRDEAAKGILREHFQMNRPLIIRGAMSTAFQSRWDPESLGVEYADQKVTALVYDKGQDQQQPVFTVNLDFADFVHFSQNTSQVKHVGKDLG
ncbi:unnamed protein product [Choristocarpus tenellus]